MVGDHVSSAPDLISDLPNSVVENILMFLPLRDAARTCVLSKKWRHKWESLPRLVFDSSFEDNLKQTPTKNELLSTIYEILLLHRGPILEFTLSISGSESFHRIDPMVQFLSRNGIQGFTLWIKRNENYSVPSCLFSCQELRHLDLTSCLFKLPAAFQGFRMLTSVSFENVNFDTDVQVFVLKCPLLEKLTMENCRNVNHLDIYAPTLKVLVIGVLFNSICFRYAPLLTTASIKGHGSQSPIVQRGESIDMNKVFGCAPNLEYLYVHFYFLMILAAGNIPERLPTSFNHLKTLVFYLIHLEVVAEVSSALCLIKSSTYLEKLEISVFSGQNDASDVAVEFLENQNRSDVSLDHLQEVKMLLFKGTKSQMEFVKFILAKSPLLERMHIHPLKGMNANEEVRLLAEITRYCRASAVAEIIYHGSNEAQF